MFDFATVVTHIDQLEHDKLEWGEIVWFCNGKLSPGSEQTMGMCTIYPGQRNPRHYHPNCEEVLHVVSGQGKHSYNDDWVDLRAGSTIRVPANVRHQLVAEGTEPLKCMIAFSSGDRQTVFLETINDER